MVALGVGCGVGEMDERDQEVEASSYIISAEDVNYSVVTIVNTTILYI